MTLPEWMICSIFMGLVAGIIDDYAFRQLLFNSSFSANLDITRIALLCLLRGFVPLFAIRSTIFVESKLKNSMLHKPYHSLNSEQRIALLMTITFALEVFSHYTYPLIGISDLGIIGDTESRSILLKIQKQRDESIASIDLKPFAFERTDQNFVEK